MHDRPSSPTRLSQAPEWVRHQKLRDWVADMAGLTKPERIVWCDGSAGGIRPPVRRDGRRRHASRRLNREAAPEQLPRALRPDRRGARGRPHLHLLRARKEDAGPTNNWVDPAEMRATLERPVRRLHARAHDVRGAVLDGPARLATSRTSASSSPTSAYVVVNMQLMTRMGRAVLDVLGADGDVRALRAFGRRAARAGAEGRRLALQRGAQVHRPFSRDARNLVLRLGLRRQRAARQEVPRAAHRLGDGPRRGLARRAHADPRRRRRRRAKSTTWRRRSRAPAARPTSRC